MQFSKWAAVAAGVALSACGGGEGQTSVDAEQATASASIAATNTADTQVVVDEELTATASAVTRGAATTTTMGSAENAARFLTQATYGATDADIAAVRSAGVSGWMKTQFTTPPMDSHWTYVVERKGPPGCKPCDSAYVNGVMESFWMQAVRGPDQLRQRLVFALSQLFVVSNANSALSEQPDALASYLDMLSRNAFGNYRSLIEQVATHPAMGKYLSHLKNDKEDAATGRIPDENFAREVMQLFSIGLWQLNQDGSRKKDAQGQDIPTYTQNDVMGMAKVFTGWSWAGADKSEERWQGYLTLDWKNQMQMYPAHHSTSAKSLLGVTIPANTSGTDTLKIALDTLFNHPNVGPFVGEQLIKRFVTSNPSRAYVGRVAAAFANNGAGVRGDMQAVIRAVLLDTEARNTSTATGTNWGKVREPVVRYGNFMRAFNVKSTSGYYQIWNLEDPVTSIGQNPLRAPNVFNWYKPTYAPSGPIQTAGLVAPEFQITHETTVTGYANFVVGIARYQSQWYRDTVQKQYGPIDRFLAADYTTELGLASSPSALIDRMKLLLTEGRMTDATRQTLIDAVTAVPAQNNGGQDRVWTAVALTMLTPEFIVQK